MLSCEVQLVVHGVCALGVQVDVRPGHGLGVGEGGQGGDMDLPGHARSGFLLDLFLLYLSLTSVKCNSLPH